jgi:hypothetical protein
MEKKVFIICEKSEGYKYQGPRYKYLGPYSGEEFREDHLQPWLDTLADGEEAVVDFFGTVVYSPSFLEEGFAGTIREARDMQESEKNKERLKHITFTNMDKDWKSKLEDYIKVAKFKPRQKIAG